MSDNAPAAPAPAPAATPAPAAPPADPAALQARDRELTELAERDPGTYHYAENRRHAIEHLEVRRALKAAQEPAPPAEQAEGDDITETDGVANADASEGEAEQEAEADVGEAEAPEVDPQWDLEDYSYEAPQGQQITEAGQQLIAEYAELAHRHSMPPEAYAASIDFLRQQQARLAENDKSARAELVADLKREMGSRYDAYKAEVNSALSALPRELNAALRSARLPDGRLLVTMPEAIRLIHRLGDGRAPANAYSEIAREDHAERSMLKQELAELHALRDRDITEYWRPWKATGKTGSERVLEITRLLSDEAPARSSAADLRAEQRELEQLRTRDPDLFRFGNWRETGRPAADRLVAIQTGRV